MALPVMLVVVLCLGSVSAASYDPLFISQPSISLKTEKDGFVGLTSGEHGSVRVNPGFGGSVYLEGDDLLYIIQMIESNPPIWQSHGPSYGKTPYGYMGEYRAGERVNIPLSAVDPEGLSITYTKVAGEFPPGLSLNSQTGNITGIVPDADATYSFTIRATDGHGKFADNLFRVVIRGYDRCSANPCQQEGICTDLMESFRCECVRPYGGTTCNLDCRSNPLGIQTSLKYVTDAQLTGYRMYSTNEAPQARIGSGNAWNGIDENSYLQIDFGNTTDIYRVDTQYQDSHYYTQYFYMQYSLDGNNFYNFTDYTGATVRLTGETGSGTNSFTLPSVLTTRYVRMFPLTWNRTYRPAFRTEMYGCYMYN